MRLFRLGKNKGNKENMKKQELQTNINIEPVDLAEIIKSSDPIKKTIFIFDEGLNNSQEGDLIRRIIRKQKGVSLYTISKKETYTTYLKIYKNEGEEVIIIRGDYRNMISDEEIEEFVKKFSNSDPVSSPKITYKTLRFRNESRNGLDYRTMIRSYLTDINKEASLNILVKTNKTNSLEEKLNGYVNNTKIEIEEPQEPEMVLLSDLSEPKPPEIPIVPVKNKEPQKIEGPAGYEAPKPISFVEEILHEQEKIIDDLIEIPAPLENSVENSLTEKTQKPFEEFLTDEEMGFRKIMPTIQIHEQYRSKISLSYQQLINAIKLIPSVWKGLFPWCEIEVNHSDSIRVGKTYGVLEDAISISIKENGNYTGDVIKINQNFLVYLKNGKNYFATPIEKALPLVINIVKNYNVDENNIVDHSNLIIREVSEIFTKRKGTTIEQIVKEKGPNAPEFKCEPGVVVCDFSDMFVKDITAEIEKIAEEKGSLAGLSAREEYKAPDSNNAGEISLKFESEPFKKFYEAYPKIREREKEIISYSYGRQIIHALVEAYNNIEIRKNRLEGIKAMVNTIPSVIDKNIIISVVDDLKNNVQSNQIDKSKINKIYV